MRNKALVTVALLALICLLPWLPAGAGPAGHLPPPAERATVLQLTPRPSVLPPPRPTLTPSPTISPAPTTGPAPAAPVVPEPSTLLLLGSAATGLGAYAGLQLRSRRRRDRSQE